MENKMLFYTPQPEEDIYELVMFTTAVLVRSVRDDFQIMYVLVVIVAGGGERVLNWESFIQSLELAEITLLTTGTLEWSGVALACQGAGLHRLKGRRNPQVMLRQGFNQRGQRFLQTSVSSGWL